jgi:hypothetical protein
MSGSIAMKSPPDFYAMVLFKISKALMKAQRSPLKVM